jgi:hypothetical protein
MDADRLRRILDALLGPVRRRLDYLALYPAEVLKDHGDNHVDVRPDDVRMSDLVRVPMETFLPGATVEVETGARVLLGFAGGDPAKPRARLWESGSLKRVVIVADEARIEATNAPSGPGQSCKALQKSCPDKGTNPCPSRILAHSLSVPSCPASMMPSP